MTNWIADGENGTIVRAKLNELHDYVDGMLEGTSGTSGIGGTSGTSGKVGTAGTSGKNGTSGISFVWASVPSSSTSGGTSGQVAYDSNYLYVCTSTNSWIRLSGSTF